MNPRQKVILVVLIAVALVAALFRLNNRSSPVASDDSTLKNAVAAANKTVSPTQTVSPTPNPGVATLTATNRVAGNPAAQTFPWFQTHPFPVAESNSIYAWTVEDGRDTNVMLHLAHNPLEYQRMLMENDTIYRRQLVYFTQGFASLAQQAMQAGQTLRQITLPGLDGQELTVAVTRTDFRNGGSQGQIYGQLPGQPDSMVTVAFLNDREAFTVMSPQDQIYLQAEAREPGEVVVKSINPATYGRLPQ